MHSTNRFAHPSQTTAEANALSQLLDLPDVRLNRNPDSVATHLNVCLAIGHAAKYLQSDAICERILQELIHVRQALENPPPPNSKPPMTAIELCVFMFTTVFDNAAVINKHMLKYFETANDAKSLQEGQPKDAKLKQLRANVLAEVTAAAEIHDLISCERTVKHALNLLESGDHLVDNTCTVTDCALKARVANLHKRIAGAREYFVDHERARTQIEQARVRGDYVRQLLDGSIVVQHKNDSSACGSRLNSTMNSSRGGRGPDFSFDDSCLNGEDDSDADDGDQLNETFNSMRDELFDSLAGSAGGGGGRPNSSQSRGASGQCKKGGVRDVRNLTQCERVEKAKLWMAHDKRELKALDELKRYRQSKGRSNNECM